MMESYKTTKGKYPEIVIIDTIEKMFSEIGPLHAANNTEMIARIANEVPSCFIMFNQMSSPMGKARQLKKGEPAPVTLFDAMGGTGVANNVSVVIGIQRIVNEVVGYTKMQFHFSKIRGRINNQKLLNKTLYASVRQYPAVEILWDELQEAANATA